MRESAAAAAAASAAASAANAMSATEQNTPSAWRRHRSH